MGKHILIFNVALRVLKNLSRLIVYDLFLSSTKTVIEKVRTAFSLFYILLSLTLKIDVERTEMKKKHFKMAFTTIAFASTENDGSF